MRLATSKWLFAATTASVVFMFGALALFTDTFSVPQRPHPVEQQAAKPQPKSKPRKPRAPKTRLPELAPEEELVILSEQPVGWSGPLPASAATVAEVPKIQYFGTTAEEVAKGQVGSGRRSAQRMPQPIRLALAFLVSKQSASGQVGDTSAEKGVAIARTAIAVQAWATAELRYSITDFRSARDAGAKWLASQQQADGHFLALGDQRLVVTGSLATSALRACDGFSEPVKRGVEALRSVQLAGGAWAASAYGDADTLSTCLATDFSSPDNLLLISAHLKTLTKPAAALWTPAASDAVADEARMLALDWLGDAQWLKSATRTDFPNTMAARTFKWSRDDADMLHWWLLARRASLEPTKCGPALAILSKALVAAQSRGSWDALHPTMDRPGREFVTGLGALSLMICAASAEAAAKAAQADTDKAAGESDKDGLGDAAEALVVSATGPGWMRERTSELLLPLQHTDVAAQISGIVATTRVTQTFCNPFGKPLEAVYCFPLPHGAAVTDFEMRIGKRRIRGVIRPRAEAEQMYSEAIAAGHTAALLTRETNGVFNHYVGNIAPDDRIDVELKFFNRVSFADGQFEWVFPMVVGPYYVPGVPIAPKAEPARVKGYGIEADTADAPNASRITPPTIPLGTRSTHDIALSVELDAGFEISQAAAVTHDVDIESPLPSQRVIRLRAGDNVPNRDFVLRWRTTIPPGGSILMAHRPDAGQPGWFCLLLNPNQPEVVRVGSDVVMLMDISGSMTGVPVELSKRLVIEAINALSPGDRFNVITFESNTAQLFPQTSPASRENVSKALQFIDLQRGGGGTEMLSGLRAALNERRHRGSPCKFVFLTDGYVGNVDQIIEYVKSNADTGEFCVFGVGNSVNRELVDGVAAAGNGRAIYCLPRDLPALQGAAAAFHGFLRMKPTARLTMNWGDLPVNDITPGALGVIQYGETTALFGQYTAQAEGKLTLSSPDQPDWAVEVALPEQEEANAGIRFLWAQSKLGEMQALLDTDPVRRKSQIEELTAFAARESLATTWTSFVAIEEQRRIKEGKPRVAVQPVELPEGVDRKGSGR